MQYLDSGSKTEVAFARGIACHHCLVSHHLVYCCSFPLPTTFCIHVHQSFLSVRDLSITKYFAISQFFYTFSVDDLRLKFVGFEGKGGEVEEIRGVEYLRISEGSGEVKLCAVMLDRLQSKSVDHRWSVESVKGVGKLLSLLVRYIMMTIIITTAIIIFIHIRIKYMVIEESLLVV